MKKQERFLGYIFRSLMVIFSFTALIGLLSYFYYLRSPHFSLKTNRFETLKITKKDIFSWLTEGAGIYLFNRYLPHWGRGAKETREHKREQKKLLHYKLQIEHIIDNDPAIKINHARPTIYLHGWGDTKNSAKLLKAFCDILPGDIITFHFRDHSMIVPKLAYSNLGQLPDVLATIYTLKWVRDEVKAKEVDLFGYSRGGATLLNTIAVLHDKTGAYDTDLKRIGIQASDRQELLAMIQRGCHVLNCPLTDMNVTIGEFIKNKSPFWIKAFESLTRYRKNGLQGLDSAQELAGLKLNMLLHFQHQDTIVSNKNEAELYTRLYKHNPQTTFMVLGNNGGHIHSHGALAHTIHTFKKMFGSSYDPEYVNQYAAIKPNIPDGSRLLRPGMQAENAIINYYEQCRMEANRKQPASPKKTKRQAKASRPK